MNYVIGSGPAGVSCAMALLERGLTVQMLDGGITLEASHQADVNRLASTPPEQWDPATLSRIKTNVEPTTEGIPQKVAFGSDFPYQQTRDFFPMTRRRVHVLPSLARGGLSTVWGAAVLPHRAEEISDWPVTLKELDPHYRAVLKFIPLSGARDDLETLFPLYAEEFDQLELSRQAKTLLGHLSQNREALQKEGIYFGRSRLSVRGRTRGNQGGCIYCGLCMYGCPYQCIYCSDQTLQSLLQRPNFSYQNDVVVKRLQETPQGITVHAVHRLTREPLSFSGTSIFLAAGILPTTQILLDSLQAYGHSLSMGYSQHFMFPMLCADGESGVARERLHTLSQLFLEVLDTEISPETIHLQVYTYNDLYDEALNRSLAGSLFRLLPRAREWALGKLLIVQGYLHSRYSSPISIRLTKPTPTDPSRLILNGHLNQEVRLKIRQLLKKLANNKRLYHATPLAPWVKISPPGQGLHTVGTFPMRQNPGPFESDSKGRPHGFENVFVVDATVLPSAPATTITLSVMANAHRIGSSADIREV